MNLLSVERLGKNFGERILFEGLSFGLDQGDKVALIASNGAGKSSLLKILAGKDSPDEGQVIFRNKCNVAYLQQDAIFDQYLTIEEILSFTHNRKNALTLEYNNAVEAHIKDNSLQTQKDLDLIIAKMDQENTWDYERRSQQILGKFKIFDFKQKVGTLSGGQKKRLSLALLLLESVDILLLDEPTNHLDIGMIEWLEKYLQQQKLTFLMVTHDRYFLERVCNNIFELESGNLYHHKGNYEYFLEKREERETSFDIEITKAQKLMKKELDWIKRQPKARGTKSKARMHSFNDIKKKATSRRVKQRLKIEMKMDRVGGKILELKNVKKSYGELIILDGFDYIFKKGERIGILGENGIGKSTFLNIITGKEKADSGKINIGETINFGYFTQGSFSTDENRRVITVLKDISDFIVMTDNKKISASQLLEHFMFTPEMQFTQVKRLSGGEKRRLHLLTVLMKNPNFLILDEPTNDLDLLTLTKLEEFLLKFKGCILIVSHDRFFLDKIIDHLFVFKGSGIIEDHYCNYSQYKLQEKQVELECKKVQDLEKKTLKVKDKSKKLNFKQKFEYDNLHKDLVQLEKEKQELELVIQNQENQLEHILSASERLAEIIQLIEDKELRWFELDEKH